ncbi:MAG: signal peptidase II [Acidobacteriota bacterium]
MNKVALRALPYVLAAAVFVLDRITKIVIKQNFSVWDTFAVIPGFFNIVHTENTGAAFSLFAGARSGWRTFLLAALSVAALAIIGVLLWRTPGGSRATRIGLALILGGALGNVYDRLIHGAVTDFLELYYRSFSWPAFNVADSAISIGACLVVLDMLRTRRAPQAT